MFNGSPEAAFALGVAIEHHCECKPGQRCGAHGMLLEQRTVDWLLYLRWLAQRVPVEHANTP